MKRPLFAAAPGTTAVFLFCLALCRPCEAAEDGTQILIREQIGHMWRGELVHWSVPDGDWKLVDQKGKSVPCQQYNHKPLAATPLNGPGLYALVDLAPHASLRWKMVPGRPRAGGSRVRIHKNPEGVVLGNEILEEAEIGACVVVCTQGLIFDQEVCQIILLELILKSRVKVSQQYERDSVSLDSDSHMHFLWLQPLHLPPSMTAA